MRVPRPYPGITRVINYYAHVINFRIIIIIIIITPAIKSTPECGSLLYVFTIRLAKKVHLTVLTVDELKCLSMQHLLNLCYGIQQSIIDNAINEWHTSLQAFSWLKDKILSKCCNINSRLNQPHYHICEILIC